MLLVILIVMVGLVLVVQFNIFGSFFMWMMWYLDEGSWVWGLEYGLLMLDCFDLGWFRLCQVGSVQFSSG